MEGIYCVYYVQSSITNRKIMQTISVVGKPVALTLRPRSQHQIVFQNSSHIYLLFLLYMIGAINCNSWQHKMSL
jgi:hypothetical protein